MGTWPIWGVCIYGVVCVVAGFVVGVWSTLDVQRKRERERLDERLERDIATYAQMSQAEMNRRAPY